MSRMARISEQHFSLEGDADAEIDFQTVLSAQAERVFVDEQFIVGRLQTPCQYAVERLENVVLQLRDEAAHKTYD